MRPDLAALVGSRICHDLISPLGAISNGVELLGLTTGDTSSEMSLITESVESANARIRFFRIAYGAATDEQSVSRSEVLSVLAASSRGGRFTYFWKVDGDQTRRDIRIAFLMLQCIETAMPLGGDVAITKDGEAWELTAHGRRVSIDQPLWDTLHNTRHTYQHSAAQVQFAMVPGVLSAAKREMTFDFSDDGITVRF